MYSKCSVTRTYTRRKSILIGQKVKELLTDGTADQWTQGRTDTPSSRIAAKNVIEKRLGKSFVQIAGKIRKKKKPTVKKDETTDADAGGEGRSHRLSLPTWITTTTTTTAFPPLLIYCFLFSPISREVELHSALTTPIDDEALEGKGLTRLLITHLVNFLILYQKTTTTTATMSTTTMMTIRKTKTMKRR